LLAKKMQIFLLILLAQGLVGYVQYATGLPELIVGFHLLGATLVWGSAWTVIKVSGSGFKLRKVK
jgi:cytochrome c oxidase assembly protein subunit 15